VSWKTCFIANDCSWSTTSGVFLPDNVERFVFSLMRDPSVKAIKIDRIEK
jgi:hypothetical protein